MQKNSSKPKPPRNLADVSKARAKKFLLELANLSDDRLSDSKRFAVANFERRYADIIPVKWLNFVEKSPLLDQRFVSGLLDLIDERNIYFSTSSFRDALRAIWIAPDFRTKQWGVFRLIENAVIGDTNPINGFPPATFNIVAGRVPPLPAPTPLEHCLRYLLQNARTAIFCANSECPAPFFFANRKSQKYCSDGCAQPAQRKFKRDWWARNGEKWRADRR